MPSKIMSEQRKISTQPLENFIHSFVRTQILGHQERLHYVIGQKPVVGRWGLLLFLHDFFNSVSGVAMVEFLVAFLIETSV